MDYIERIPILENQSLDIYDARLTFRKTRQGEKVVTVTIRYSKRKHAKKGKFSFPENIRDDDLCWRLYRGEHISVYHRMDTLEYIDMKHSLVHTDLGQKLERLIREAHNRFMKMGTREMRENNQLVKLCN